MPAEPEPVGAYPQPPTVEDTRQLAPKAFERFVACVRSCADGPVGEVIDP